MRFTRPCACNLPAAVASGKLHPQRSHHERRYQHPGPLTQPRQWAVVHDNTRIPALRRRYLTATPRLWQLDEDQEPGGAPGELVASIEDDLGGPFGSRCFTGRSARSRAVLREHADQIQERFRYRDFTDRRWGREFRGFLYGRAWTHAEGRWRTPEDMILSFATDLRVPFSNNIHLPELLAEPMARCPGREVTASRLAAGSKNEREVSFAVSVRFLFAGF
jgi:hypothetical protein